MKNLYEYINEAYTKGKKKITLPYTFDIYNEGDKNKDFKITKSNIYHIYFSLEDGVDRSLDSSIELPLAADDIQYAEPLDKETTKNWTAAPRIRTNMYAGAWYSDKKSEYNYNKYNEDWNTWLRSLKPWMKGKIEVTLLSKDSKLTIHVNDNDFNKKREEKIKELSDVDKIKKFGHDVDERENKRIKELEAERIKREEEIRKYNDFLNSMPEKERLAYLRQADYDRNYLRHYHGPGRYTGD